MPFWSTNSMETLKYPCRKCSKEVDGENGILCEGLCQSWYHASCVCVTDKEYDCLAASDDRWECPECVGDALPPHNSRDVMDVLHFDFQKNLLTPKITVGQQFTCGYFGPTCSVFTAPQTNLLRRTCGMNCLPEA